MESLGRQTFLDGDGRPLDPRIQAVLRDLAARFLNKFWTLHDEVLATEILEEAGVRVTQCESASGPVKNLEAYAWTTVVNIARTRLRHSSMRVERATLASDASQSVLASLTSHDGTPDQIEADILLQEFVARMTAHERAVFARKKSGCSSRQIAGELGISVASVNMVFYRIKLKCRELQNEKRTDADLSMATISSATKARTDVIPSP